MGTVTTPLDLGLIGIQYRDAPSLSSTLGWVQDPNLNLGLELNTRLGAIGPRVVPKSPVGTWPGTWRGWKWSGVRAHSGESRTSSSTICGKDSGIPMTGAGGRVMSDSGRSRAGKNRDISRTGGGGSVAGCRACCAFCGCRRHREGWQESSSLFVRTVFPCSLGFQ